MPLSGDLIEIVAIVMVMLIPIVAILTSHQRKMAEVIHNKEGQVPQQELMRMAAETQLLRDEVARLREMVHQQAIVVDDLRALAKTSGARPEGVEDRLRST